MELLLKINDYEQTMIAITTIQFIGFLLIFIWTRNDGKKD
jgi:hypothetical protein